MNEVRCLRFLLHRSVRLLHFDTGYAVHHSSYHQRRYQQDIRQRNTIWEMECQTVTFQSIVKNSIAISVISWSSQMMSQRIQLETTYPLHISTCCLSYHSSTVPGSVLFRQFLVHWLHFLLHLYTDFWFLSKWRRRTDRWRRNRRHRTSIKTILLWQQ